MVDASLLEFLGVRRESLKDPAQCRRSPKGVETVPAATPSPPQALARLIARGPSTRPIWAFTAGAVVLLLAPVASLLLGGVAAAVLAPLWQHNGRREAGGKN